MTPEKFIATWKNNALTERAGAQGHFDDLCELLGVDKPRDPESYCFERGAKKAGGGADAAARLVGRQQRPCLHAILPHHVTRHRRVTALDQGAPHAVGGLKREAWNQIWLHTSH